jgi:hypothetical protein
VRELVTLREARERLGISKTTMSKHVRLGRFTVYSNPKDTREKLVDWREVEAAFAPQPIRLEREGKAAA